MGLKDAQDVSISGIQANRIHMEIIASNLANIATTRTEGGGPYRRKMPIFAEKPIEFSQALTNAENRVGGGIEVSQIVEDPTPFPKVFNPGHPDADKDGFVRSPNVSYSKEMADMVYVNRLYDANITTYNTTKKMSQEILQLQ